MTNVAYAAGTRAPPLFRSVERLRGALLWLTGFAGAIVFMEPSPYEVTSLLTIVVFIWAWSMSCGWGASPSPARQGEFLGGYSVLWRR